MKKFKVTVWHMEQLFENSYYPCCVKYVLEIKAYNENTAMYKAAHRFGFFNCQNIAIS